MCILPKVCYNNIDLIKGYDMSRIKDRTGQKWNRLEAVSFSHKDSNNNAHWLYKCDCGKEHIAHASQVANGQIKSCGCLLHDINVEKMTTHNMSRTKTYKSWINMKDRCLNPKNKYFDKYGERGIIVCDRWLENFDNFLEDMGELEEGQSIERLDNNLNYEPSNCKWGSAKEQQQNKSNSKYWFIHGTRYESMYDAAKAKGVSPYTIRAWCNGYKNYSKYGNEFHPPKDGCYSELKYKGEE